MSRFLTIEWGIATFVVIMSILGIHHVTSLASDPQRNLEFYTGFLGLRLVKQTVNFDAPDVYHLYYGDEIGQPGTILTFFPFPDAARGKKGAGETSAVAFSVPVGAFPSWIERLSRQGMPFHGPDTRLGESVISFEDPDGMIVELIEDPAVTGPDFSIRRFHGVTITHREAGPTTALLTKVLGFSAAGREGSRHRFVAGTGEGAGRVDVVVDADAPAARQSAGSVHHIAWRVKDDDEQLRWRQKLAAAGASPTKVVDRCYFHSIYFHEPGGVLFEIATDPPGFAIDETVQALGTRLQLPPWLETERALIERHLPPLTLPSPAARGTP
jgi:glyoxalase family protein